MAKDLRRILLQSGNGLAGDLAGLFALAMLMMTVLHLPVL